MFEIKLYSLNQKSLDDFLDKINEPITVKLVTEQEFKNDSNNNILVLNESGILTLRHPNILDQEFYLDFDSEYESFLKEKNKQKLNSDPFYRLFISKGHKELVDASLGLAKDALHLIFLGAKIEGFERNPSVFLMLMDALKRVKNPSLKDLLFDSFKINFGELKHTAPVIYFDPMFPEKKKSALPKKEMQLFQKVLGHDEDQKLKALELKNLSSQRLIIKRPTWAPPLLEKPNYTIETKLVRFDVY